MFSGLGGVAVATCGGGATSLTALDGPGSDVVGGCCEKVSRSRAVSVKSVSAVGKVKDTFCTPVCCGETSINHDWSRDPQGQRRCA